MTQFIAIAGPRPGPPQGYSVTPVRELQPYITSTLSKILPHVSHDRLWSLYKAETEAGHDFCYETMERMANGDPFQETPLATWLTMIRPTCVAIVLWYANKEFDLPRTLDWDVFTSTLATSDDWEFNAVFERA